MSINILKTQIKNSDIKSLYLFYGPEEFLKKYYIKSIEDKILDKNTITFNKTILEDKIAAEKVVDSCDTLPVFAERKLVIVKNSGFFKSSNESKKLNKKENKSQKSKSNTQIVLDYIKDIPDYTCLIFYENEVDKRIKLTSEIKKKGLIVEFPYQKHEDLIKWVKNIVKSNNKHIDTDTASFLVEISDFGMTGIRNEIDKLLVYTGERKTITIDDIKKVGSITAKSIIFDLTDAIAGKNIAVSFKILDEMVTLKEPIPKIIYMISRQFRQLYQVKILLENGMSSREIISKLSIHPYAFDKLKKFCPNFTIDRLKNNMIDLYECDKAIKTGKMKDRMAVELLIEKLTF